MKKIILILILIAAFTELKAQQSSLLSPDLKLSNGLKNFFKPTYPSPQTLLLQTKSYNAFKVLKQAANSQAFYSRMPVIKLQNTDNMPVVVPGEKGVKYTMLIKKITVIDPAQQAPVPAP